MQIHAASSEHSLDCLAPQQAKYTERYQGVGTLRRSCKHAIFIKKQNDKPLLLFACRHIGTVMIFFPSSSTMRDFPVPDEFTMVVSLA